MKIVCISDTHGKETLVPDGDMIIHAGDISSLGKYDQVFRFLSWFSALPHKHKVFIGGNHDIGFERQPLIMESILEGFPNVKYLQQSSVEIEGIKIWGSPYTPKFFNWAFMYDRENAAKYWDAIPEDTNVLITHGPPYGILDYVNNGFNRDPNVGCKQLADRVAKLKHLALHVFGHIHNGRGEIMKDGTMFVNASVLDEEYKPFNLEPYVFDYKRG